MSRCDGRAWRGVRRPWGGAAGAAGAASLPGNRAQWHAVAGSGSTRESKGVNDDGCPDYSHDGRAQRALFAVPGTRPRGMAWRVPPVYRTLMLSAAVAVALCRVRGSALRNYQTRSGEKPGWFQLGSYECRAPSAVGRRLDTLDRILTPLLREPRMQLCPCCTHAGRVSRPMVADGGRWLPMACRAAFGVVVCLFFREAVRPLGPASAPSGRV